MMINAIQTAFPRMVPNARLLKSGGKIMLLPEVRIHYFARPTLGKLSLMFYQYGLFKPLVNAKLGKPATLRQLFPPAFVAALLLLPLVGIYFSPGWSLWFIMTGLYLILDLLVSMRLSLNKQAVLFPFLLLVFPVIHISYGLGYWKGIVRFLIFRKYSRSREYGISR